MVHVAAAPVLYRPGAHCATVPLVDPGGHEYPGEQMPEQAPWPATLQVPPGHSIAVLGLVHEWPPGHTGYATSTSHMNLVGGVLREGVIKQ
jgi:hypothetical protein